MDGVYSFLSGCSVKNVLRVDRERSLERVKVAVFKLDGLDFSDGGIARESELMRLGSSWRLPPHLNLLGFRLVVNDRLEKVLCQPLGLVNLLLLLLESLDVLEVANHLGQDVIEKVRRQVLRVEVDQLAAHSGHGADLPLLLAQEPPQIRLCTRKGLESLMGLPSHLNIDGCLLNTLQHGL